MAGIAVSNRVIARNSIGQFAAACDRAATETVREAIDRGAELSRSMAPVGHKPDPRTVPLAQSIKARMLSATAGVWEADARHAMAIEFGAGVHEIPGDVSFFWESAGRMWIPYSEGGPPWLHPIIVHPGNAAQPYLRPAYKVVMGEVMSIARKHYPG